MYAEFQASGHAAQVDINYYAFSVYHYRSSHQRPTTANIRARAIRGRLYRAAASIAYLAGRIARARA